MNIDWLNNYISKISKDNKLHVYQYSINRGKVVNFYVDYKAIVQDGTLVKNK